MVRKKPMIFIYNIMNATVCPVQTTVAVVRISL